MDLFDPDELQLSEGSIFTSEHKSGMDFIGSKSPKFSAISSNLGDEGDTISDMISSGLLSKNEFSKLSSSSPGFSKRGMSKSDDSCWRKSSSDGKSVQSGTWWCRQG